MPPVMPLLHPLMWRPLSLSAIVMIVLVRLRWGDTAAIPSIGYPCTPAELAHCEGRV